MRIVWKKIVSDKPQDQLKEYPAAILTAFNWSASTTIITDMFFGRGKDHRTCEKNILGFSKMYTFSDY